MDLNNKYFVVCFLEKPYSTIDSEVCVPFKWAKLSKKTNDIVSVAYPAEYSPSTREMVQNIHAKRDEWHYYKVQVKCGKRSFEAAERYIKARNQINTESEKTECSNTEINESESAFNINSFSSSQNSSPSLATKDTILRNNRSDPIKLSIKRSMTNISLNDLFKKPRKTVKTSELISETPNHSNGSGKNFCENKLVSLDFDCLNQKQHDTTDVKLSNSVSNIVEQTVLERSAENESSSIPASQYCQPLTDTHEENLQTVIIHSPNEQSQQSDVSKNNKLNTIDDRLDCRSRNYFYTSEATRHSTKFERKLGRPLKHTHRDPRYLPFWNYTHPHIIKQMQLAQTSKEMYGNDLSGQPPINTKNTPAQNSTYQSRCLSDHSHQHQSPATQSDSIHRNLQSQNQPGPSSAEVNILEEKIMVTSNSNVANPSSEVSSHNNQLFKINQPISYSDQHQREKSIQSSINAHDNVQEMCPNIPTIIYPSGLYGLGELVAQKPHLLSHPHNEQLLTIKAMEVYQEPRTQEILHRRGEVNSINDRICPQSAPDQEARTQIVIDKSTEMNPIKQSDSSQITSRKVFNKRNRHNPVKVIPINNKYSQEGVRKPRITSEIPIEIINVNQNSQNREICENTPTAVQNCSSSCYQSSCPWNGSSGKESLLVTQDQLSSEPRHKERHIGKTSKLNYTEKSIYFKNDTNKETPSVQSTYTPRNTNQPIKKSCNKNHFLEYKHCMQEQFSPNSEDFSDQEMPTEEITAEKLSENNHIETTTCPEMNTEQASKIPNLSASIYTLPELKSIAKVGLLRVIQNVKEMQHATDEISIQLKEAFEHMLKVTDRCLSVQQNNITESVSQEQQVKAEEKSAKNENKGSKLDLNYVADGSDDDDDDNDDSNDSNFSVNNKHKDDTNENDHGFCEPPKKIRGKKRSFVLPPEYNAHDSKWTLKYQLIEPGVVELVPNSKIYISDLKLANCKRVSRDYKTFGRKLLVEIFSRNALSVCSLTGARANAFDVHDSDIRPGLDKEARSILLTYVEEYGRKQSWGQFDTQSVINSLRSKIQDIRSKYGSTV